MLSHIRCINGIPVCIYFIQRLHDTLRIYARLHLNTQRMLFIPSLDFLYPFFMLHRLRVIKDLPNRHLGIRHDWNIYRYISGNCRRLDINMDNLGMRGELRYISRHSVIKPASNGKHQITFIRCFICRIGAMHTDIAYI